MAERIQAQSAISPTDRGRRAEKACRAETTPAGGRVLTASTKYLTYAEKLTNSQLNLPHER